MRIENPSLIESKKKMEKGKKHVFVYIALQYSLANIKHCLELGNCIFFFTLEINKNRKVVTK